MRVAPQLVSAVHRAIAALDADARAVLVLRDIEGLSGQETAARLKLSLAAMKTRLHRARLTVRASVLECRARTVIVGLSGRGRGCRDSRGRV